ncbi:MAG TPA: hypothetical protein VNX23_02900 [Bradyrhizobium sp.]|jgi:hypothetical protein|uniref:hypothetical protein n=1 Tax=Bradyrhizobium sp. TaxID=376 RepID=UPI002C134456|nr:hypothetical protein [Bradyrhizobium sp.]HXB76353.1 hypothetical protein [Bradyrhizobium sp.]
MRPGNTVTPVIIALIIAVVGTLVLLNMDLPRNAVRNSGLDKQSRAAIAKAGAKVTPTIQASE